MGDWDNLAALVAALIAVAAVLGGMIVLAGISAAGIVVGAIVTVAFESLLRTP